MNHPLSKALAIAIAVSAAGCATTVPPDDTPATKPLAAPKPANDEDPNRQAAE